MSVEIKLAGFLRVGGVVKCGKEASKQVCVRHSKPVLYPSVRVSAANRSGAGADGAWPQARAHVHLAPSICVSATHALHVQHHGQGAGALLAATNGLLGALVCSICVSPQQRQLLFVLDELCPEPFPREEMPTLYVQLLGKLAQCLQLHRRPLQNPYL
ncbi:hypothetical protein NDU88_002813 [Pleurodeles waltl]|uniref:Uncharacterized protein n=1 Tax=Pleurodeles waltl TaxID=8319 RepID=A0AAV7PAS9_PLEWA|nr:hypothetical protein NDU88_002813 [Pleurodeles waltl]